ncbi:hypothetical protein [Pseudomonas sp. B392_1p]|uniref:hypothetical protein n=1 Tax=Pseudomonas sp. B392_1p TaxID=3457507 RepID=UPI003FD324E6
MSGLDTRGAFDGFVQGFGLVENFKQRKADNARADQQMAMQERGLQMREQEFAAQQQQRQSQQDQQQIAQFYQGWSSGIEAPITPELEQAFERNKLADPRHLFNPKTEAAVQYADRLAQGEGSLFSQQTVDAMNDFYGPRVSRGSGGKKRLAGMYPGQKDGTFVFELEVEDERGGKRLAPMTVNRGTADEDDEVAQYEIDQAIGPVMGAKSLYQALGQNRDKMLGYLQASGYLPKTESWEQVEGPDGAVLQRNSRTGEMKSVIGRKNDGAGSAAFAPSNDVKTLQWLMSPQGGGLTNDEARDELVRLKRGGGEGSISAGDRYRVTFLTNQIKEIDSQLEAFPGPEAEAALRQQRGQLVQARQALASDLGLAGVPAQPEPQGQPARQGQPKSPQQAPQPGQVEDGFLFLGGDPADPENWSKQ